jgi:hypothetical protein
LLQELLGSQDQRQKHEDFVRRYEQGPPTEGFSAEEALAQHQTVAQHLPAKQYEEAALLRRWRRRRARKSDRQSGTGRDRGDGPKAGYALTAAAAIRRDSQVTAVPRLRRWAPRDAGVIATDALGEWLVHTGRIERGDR